MSEDDQGDFVDVQSVEAAVDQGGVGADVHEDAAALAGGDHAGVALAYVAGDEEPVSWGPRGEEGCGEQECRAACQEGGEGECPPGGPAQDEIGRASCRERV